ncbi:type I methionyl aminopeptidase [Luteimicrobium xylanilyticum]|uniref:Methionine aminopeptidase n=1 Tax=Luteimicrobium xylanilyticum TaxID=1133546 RepID=A0A5P9Q890_9MICO|nr:type I methionyl aminopeptidase [Luteimicrobium xylanilyticum]QFU97340.1 Methionyl aminopeptidase [Luteimicrobium xylanilyticum]
MFGRDRIEYKTPDQVRLMRRAGLVVADVHDAVRAAVAVGVTTADLDAVAADVIRAAGATSSFLGYEGYPATVCVSVNDEVIHGIPGERVLRPGDVVSVDAGAVVGGWHGDAAFSVVLPGPDGAAADPADVALVDATERAMWAGIAALAAGGRIGDVGVAVEEVAEGGPYGIVEDYVGHGIGTQMHQDPDVPNYRTRGRGPRVRPGLCVAVEPMLTRGDATTQLCEDEWTVVTDDGSRAAHCEHTVAVLEGGLWVLTAPDGGAAGLAPFGVTVAPLD